MVSGYHMTLDSIQQMAVKGVTEQMPHDITNEQMAHDLNVHLQPYSLSSDEYKHCCHKLEYTRP